MGRKAIASVAVVLTIGLAMTVGFGEAGAAEGPAVSAGGVTTCTITGQLTFSPALVGTSGGTSTATVSATLSKCSKPAHHKASVTGGRLQGLVGSVSPDNCTSIAISHVAPPLSGGSVAWTSQGKVTSSNGVSFPSGGATVVTIHKVTFLQVSYSGGSVKSGSFANAGGSSMTVTSDQNDAQLSGKCSSRKGLSSVGFRGTTTL